MPGFSISEKNSLLLARRHFADVALAHAILALLEPEREGDCQRDDGERVGRRAEDEGAVRRIEVRPHDAHESGDGEDREQDRDDDMAHKAAGAVRGLLMKKHERKEGNDRPDCTQ